MGPRAVGGSEVVLSEIEAAMDMLGFASVVVAQAGSEPHGRLYPVPVPSGEITEDGRELVERAVQEAIDRALAENPIALIHFHGLDFHRYRIPAGIPALVTLHLPPSWYPDSIWSLPSNYELLCVSEAERAACPEHVRDRITVVRNGVRLPDRSLMRPTGRYALMLARICPEKNLHTGLDAARIAEMPVMLAGEIFPYPVHQQYFNEQIAPRLTQTGTDHQHRATEALPCPEARFLGPVTGAVKTRLLARAACLLLPSLAPETSSLVAMEALAAGIPVIGMTSGAIPEIVQDGVTGFLIEPGADAAERMADAIRALPSLDRNACRVAAEERFDLDRMLAAYAALYNTRALEPTLPIRSVSATPPISTEEVPRRMVQLKPLWVEDAQALKRFVEPWRKLWDRDLKATPFQHPAWLLPWWRQFGADGQMHTLALEDGEGRLQALLPLYLYRTPDGLARKLLLIGAGTSDYLDGLWHPDGDPSYCATIGLNAALDALQTSDCVALTQLRENSPLLSAAAQGNGLTPPLRQSEAEPCSIISTALDLPAKLRANTRRYRRHAEAEGQLALCVVQDPAEALGLFGDLVQMHGERWRARGESGVLADPRVRAHHQEAIPALLDAGLLRLFRLTLNGATIGALYALADPPHRPRRSLYLYLIGFDRRFAQLSPGTLLLHAVWEYARREGFAYLDLLRGGEAYKHLWGAQPRPTYALVTETRT